MSMKPLLLSTLLCALPLLISTSGMAQASAASAEQTEARTAYRKALAEMEKGNWQGAQTLLSDLWKKSPTFDVAGSLGEVETRLGHYARAAQRIAFALKNVPPKEKAETSTRLRAALDDLRPRVSTLRLSVNRDSAEILVDGESVGTYPQLSEVYLDAGKHTIEGRSGGESAKREVQAALGATTSLSLDFKPESVTSGLAAPPTATPPGAPPPQVAPKNDDSDWSHSPRTIAVVIGGTLTMAGLATGVGFGLASNSAKDDADGFKARLSGNGCAATPVPTDCKALDDALSRQQRDGRIGNVGFGIAAVGAVTVGVALLWPSSKEPAARRASTSVALRWSGDRLLLDGTF